MTFETYIHLVFAITLWCCGFYIITRKGMILGWVDEWAEKHLPEMIYKPLTGCITCMSSVHSALIVALYILIFSKYYFQFLFLPPIALSCAFLNTFAWHLMEYFRNWSEKIEKENKTTSP